MTQRLRGISDAEATGAAKEVFDASNSLLGRTANLLRIADIGMQAALQQAVVTGHTHGAATTPAL